MSISKVYFASRELAESLIGKPSMAVISITDPGSPPANLHAQFEHILRLAFFDAVPADAFLPAPMPGLFDYRMARQIATFVQDLHNAPDAVSVLVHCEYGVSRSAAVALFVEAWSGAPLISREFTGEANQWVVDQLSQLRPELDIDIPPANAAAERRSMPRPA
ncbi:MAG: dual specificity protein phosphatase family protein [Dechloromonas sp.]|uniref:hypothetical protein n=1 Tax=Ferribacterium limneticum TaxID=76259 RepID=UPI001CF7FBC2|nr:hypothetical protein [Ferribacterium limneticum]MBT9519937.1 dual specificity protein phosphatase family protein [Dechloromonas sp.]UCV23980.1 dual specificity protein phosphatase family protein [Ferribacterium limneticum]